MQRYTVHIIEPAKMTARPVLLVPFEPSALVARFLEELFVRLARQSIPLLVDTHVCTLHLDSESGAIIDGEDIVGHVMLPSDALFAVFSPAAVAKQPPGPVKGDVLSVRVITAARAKTDKSALPILTIPVSSTVKELHERVADQLALPRTSTIVENECNCTLAKKLSDGLSPASSFLVIHDKSKVQRIDISVATEVEITAALKAKFGDEVTSMKQVTFHGEERSHSAFDTSYKKTPVVSICAKHRHFPRHAKVTHEDGSEQQHRLLDLHTYECPISRACQDVSLYDTGIAALAVDGVIDIYAVNRAATKELDKSNRVGKSTIFRYRSHWEPSVKQSDRGIAMMLSSLRVFASNVQEMDDRRKDAVFHVFDLLAAFPPALRSLYLLIQGKTITSVESSALSHALFEVLESYIPTEMIGTDGSRLFEAARLLFGFILEKARILKLDETHHDGMSTVATPQTMPYLNAFSIVDVQDLYCLEPVMDIVRTTAGNVERSLHLALQQGGLLFDSHIRSEVSTPIECPSDITRVALLTAGTAGEIAVFSISALANRYRYADSGQMPSAFDPSELSELDHVAGLCGRNNLAVHKPSQLASATAPSLTFDRNAHLTVYNGPEPCSVPGESAGIFRPRHGDEVMNATVVEQLIAPILARYEADGTSVFDMLGGSAVRRLQAPDEIVMFAVDCSASMRSSTDFLDVNDDAPLLDDEDPTAETLVEAHFFTRTSFEDVKELLSNHESFDDMLAIIADASPAVRRSVAAEVIGLVRMELSLKVVDYHTKLERLQELTSYGSRIGTQAAQQTLDRAKVFWASLKTCESPLVDFLLFRATTTPDIATRFMWYPGQDIPSGAPAGIIPSLPPHVTAVPDGLQCPISHGLMEDAVTAPDNFSYSRSAITQWFSIRKSSPMTGLELQDITLRPNHAISAVVASWIMGNDTISQPRLSPRSIQVKFNSRVGTFQRDVDPSTTITSLYRLVFSGLKARFSAFQLVMNGRVLSLSGATLRTSDFKSGGEITIRLADDGDMAVSASGTTASKVSGEMCLIKVYDRGLRQAPCFSYWVKRATTQSINSILFKFWRYKFSSGGLPQSLHRQIWTDMRSSGDGFSAGSPQDPSDGLAIYLNRSHCSGHLGPEPLFDEAKIDTDSGNELSTTRSGASPLVLKVSVSNMWSKRRGRDNATLSRLDVLKQMFEALINRLIAYNYKTHVGLVTFASEAKVSNGISHVLENFRRAISEMNASGDTALWDALALSLDQIQQSALSYPAAKKRIIVISDGVNTKSTSNTCEEIAWRMKVAGVSVDTISIGGDEDQDLQALSWFLGCFSFHPTSLANALAICEMEPFLSATERPDIHPRTKATNRLQFRSSFLNARFAAQATVVSEDRFPARRAHENQADDFVQLSRSFSRPNTTVQSDTRSKFRITRVMKEINQMVTKEHPQYDIYVSETNLAFWKVVLSGPDDSPYAQGNFLLYLDMQPDYPTFAPEVRFITKMMHPNINAHGRVCHPLLGRDWTTDTSMTTVLDTIYGLLFQAEVSDQVSTLSTLEYHADGVEFAEAVREHVQRHALKSRAEWQSEFLGEVDSGENEDVDDEMSY